MATINTNGIANILEKSETAQVLLSSAKDKGVKLQFADNLRSGIGGYFDSVNNLIVVKKGSEVFMVSVLAHELVHANAPKDETSIAEEVASFEAGDQVLKEAGIIKKTRSRADWLHYVQEAYAGGNLDADNGFKNDLAKIGINYDADGLKYVKNTSKTINKKLKSQKSLSKSKSNTYFSSSIFDSLVTTEYVSDHAGEKDVRELLKYFITER